MSQLQERYGGDKYVTLFGGRAGGHGVSFYMYIAVKDFLIVFITMQKKPIQSRGVPFGYPR
tara:strand:+ start:312 stop:494 length:183 start_codon:yes stop_codon:yes gene_type:complete